MKLKSEFGKYLNRLVGELHVNVISSKEIVIV